MFTIPRGSVAKAGLLLVLVPFASQGEVVIASGQVFMSPANVTNFHSMEARIVGATGDVYHATSFGETLVWQCDGCADGAYGVEVRTTAEVGVSETGEGPKPLLRVEAIEHQRFVVQGGWVTPAALRSDSGESGIEAPSILSRVARAVLDAVLPAAQAVDLTASSVFPSVFFDDTFIDASPSNNFRLICLASTGNTSNICEFQDLGLGSRPMFNFTSNTSSLRMGVGTPVPATALHIATPQSPMILLDSPGTDFLFGLDDSNDDVAFGFSSNASGPVGTILTLENDLNSTIYPGVGIWKVNPRAALHVGSHDHMSAQLRVENNLAPTKAGDAVMLQLTNPGKKAVGLRINAGGSFWQISNTPAVNSGAGANSGELRISKLGARGVEFSVNGFGDGRFLRRSIATQHVNVSSRSAKTDFEAVDEKSVLQKLASLPISTWRYRAEAPDGEHKHIGPVAEDFQRTFGWSDGNHISTVDANGVALAAIKGLHRRLEEQNRSLEEELTTLKRELQDKDRQLQALSAQVSAVEALVRGGGNLTAFQVNSH